MSRSSPATISVDRSCRHPRLRSQKFDAALSNSERGRRRGRSGIAPLLDNSPRSDQPSPDGSVCMRWGSGSGTSAKVNLQAALVATSPPENRICGTRISGGRKSSGARLRYPSEICRVDIRTFEATAPVDIPVMISKTADEFIMVDMLIFLSDALALVIVSADAASRQPVYYWCEVVLVPAECDCAITMTEHHHGCRKQCGLAAYRILRHGCGRGLEKRMRTRGYQFLVSLDSIPKPRTKRKRILICLSTVVNSRSAPAKTIRWPVASSGDHPSEKYTRRTCRWASALRTTVEACNVGRCGEWEFNESPSVPPQFG